MNRKKIISILVAVSMTMMISSYSVSAAQGMPNMGQNNNSYSHGDDTTITEDMLTTSDSIPSDYDVKEYTQGKAKNGDYLSLFDTENIQDVYINLAENNWNYLLQNASDTPTVLTDSVTIGDETVKYASIKTKGNLTLRSVWNSNSDRFSFTVNFGKYIKKKNGYSDNQNFHGLSKVAFNNIYGDPTLMKEYLSYNLMTELGVKTPEYSLVNLHINGQLWGVYMMVESIDSSLTKRTLGEDNTFLTKPERSGGDLIYNDALDKYYDETTETFNFGTNAESMINFDISNPVLNVSLSSRPLLNVLLQNDEYYAKYTKYLNDCCIIASEGGTTSDGNTYAANNYSTIIDNFEKLLSVNYAKDPTAFYTVDQYETAINTLKQIIKLRSTAVINQINGNTEKLTTDLNLNTMGDSTGGGNPGGNPNGGGDRPISTLTDETSKITVSGMFPNEATLNITNLTSGDDYNKAISSVEKTDGNSLYVYNINLDMNNMGNFNNNQTPPEMPDNNNQAPPEMPDDNNNNQAPPEKTNDNNNNFGPGNFDPGNFGPGNFGFEKQYNISFTVSETDPNNIGVYQVNEDGTSTKLTGTLENEKYTVNSSSLGLFVLSTKNGSSQSEGTTSESTTNSGNTDSGSSSTEVTNTDNDSGKDNSNTVSTKDASTPFKASIGLLASLSALIINKKKNKNN